MTTSGRQADLAGTTFRDEGDTSHTEIALQLASAERVLTSTAAGQTRGSRGDFLPDPDTAYAARAFLSRLNGEYAPVKALLYGSRARGTHTVESDADIAVVLKGRKGNRYRAVRELSDAAHDVLLETGIYIQPLPIWQSELERPETFGNSALLDIIRREGLRL